MAVQASRGAASCRRNESVPPSAVVVASTNTGAAAVLRVWGPAVHSVTRQPAGPRCQRRCQSPDRVVRQAFTPGPAISYSTSVFAAPARPSTSIVATTNVVRSTRRHPVSQASTCTANARRSRVGEVAGVPRCTSSDGCARTRCSWEGRSGPPRNVGESRSSTAAAAGGPPRRRAPHPPSSACSSAASFSPVKASAPGSTYFRNGSTTSGVRSEGR